MSMAGRVLKASIGRALRDPIVSDLIKKNLRDDLSNPDDAENIEIRWIGTDDLQVRITWRVGGPTYYRIKVSEMI